MASILRVRTVFSGVSGTPWYSNLYFDATTETGTSVTVATAAFWTTLKVVISNLITMNVEADVAVIDDVTGDITDLTTGTAASILGTASDEALPRATQGLIRARTGTYVGGREIRGRVFVPGLTQQANDAGRPVGSFVTTLAGAAANLRDADVGWVVWSRARGQSAPVQSVSAWTQFASMRSRRD